MGDSFVHRRQMRDLSRQLTELEIQVARQRLWDETPAERSERLRLPALERAALANQRFQPFAHLFRDHLREQVRWLAAAVATGDVDQTVDGRLLGHLLAMALEDPAWSTLLADAGAAVRELDESVG
jgi:hypothetical protein